MDAAQLMGYGMKLIMMFSPFLFIYLAITYANEIIELIRNAIFGGRRKDWD